MSVQKGVGIGIAVASLILCVSTYYGTSLKRALALFFLVLGLGYPTAVYLAFGSLVNPMAAPWGTHALWKIIVAGMLYVTFPLALLGLRALLMSPRFLGALLRQSTREDPRAAMPDPTEHELIEMTLVWLPLAFFAIQSIHLIISVIQTPIPPPPEWLVQKSTEQGFGWVLLHPTPAIHHTYAGATFLWSLALGSALSCFAFPIARWIVDLTQRPRIMKVSSLVAAAVGVILAVAG